jgi:hypothetical protein
LLTVGQGLRRVLFGEKAAFDVPSATADVASCRAAKFQQYDVTINMVLTIGLMVGVAHHRTTLVSSPALQIHFSLDSAQQFRLDSPRFHYKKHYYALLKAFEDMSPETQEDLLLWYKEYAPRIGAMTVADNCRHRRVMPRETRARKSAKRGREGATTDWMQEQREAKRQRDSDAAAAGAAAMNEALLLGGGRDKAIADAAAAASASASGAGATLDGVAAAAEAAAKVAAAAIPDAQAGA